jgi:phenylacetate-CoA oxygenase PaaI subunit
MTDLKKLPDLAPEASEALRNALLSLADSKRMMGIRYSDWLLGAPSLETGIAASSMTQDEWGHSRLLYAMLKVFGEDPVALEHDRPDEAYGSLAALDEPWDDWAGLVAAITIVDEGLTVCLEGLANGAYEPARNRIPKMVAEEKFHSAMGQAWYRRLAHASEEAQASLKSHSERMLPSVLALLDPGDEAVAALAGAGLQAEGSELRARFEARVGPVLAEAGIDVGSVEPDTEGWDAARRRGAGSPAHEAAERARGDRNRSLFVE